MALGTSPALTSIEGRRLGIGAAGNVVANDTALSAPAMDATITVGAEVGDARAITIQIKDVNGVNINYIETLDILMYLDAAGAAYVVTGGTTGIAIGASGALLTVVAKKFFRARTTVAGLLALTWTDTGTEAAFLGVKLPGGRVVISTALTNA
jgi:hypothetical protein